MNQHWCRCCRCYYIIARSQLCQWEPNIDWHVIMSTEVNESMRQHWKYILIWHWYCDEARPLSISMRPLTHWGLVTHICVSEVGHRHNWFRWWLIAWGHQAIALTNTDLLSIGHPGKKKLQWNSNQNSTIFIEQNAFENVVCSFSPNRRRLNVLTVPALHISVYFSCRQESLLWILMCEWYDVNARSYLYLCQWEPNMDWQSVMSTRVVLV